MTRVLQMLEGRHLVTRSRSRIADTFEYAIFAKCFREKRDQGLDRVFADTLTTKKKLGRELIFEYGAGRDGG